MSALCGYDRERFDPVTLASVAPFHSHSVAAAPYHDDPVLRICRQYLPPGIRLAGEMDFLASEVLALALSEAIRMDGDITINMTDLPALDQAFDSGTLYALRAAVQAHTSAAGMPERRADDVVIAVHELAANVIQHGVGRGRLRMWKLPGALRFQVDEGSGTASADGGRRGGPNVADHWPYLKGHGLWLVREVADKMSLSSGSGGTRATVVFAIPR